MRNRLIELQLVLCGMLLLSAGRISHAQAAGPATQPVQTQIKHVLLIGLDGARADAIRDHAGPAIRSLIDAGTSCWQTEAELPSVTQVNWASILSGSTPARHGIDRHPISAAELSSMRVGVPTIFDAVAAHGLHAAGFLGHWKLYPNESTHPNVHIERSSYESARIGPHAAAYIVKHRPAFCFVYIGDLDGLGHRHGWMSGPYLAGIAKVDQAVQTLLDALDQADIRQQTLIVLTSDHGGQGRSHSEGTLECRLVPLVLTGPGIAGGRTIDTAISVSQIAPTILSALGMAIPPEWDGRALRHVSIGSP